jgi:hypothetical protein
MSVGRRALEASALEEKKRMLRSGLYRAIQVPDCPPGAPDPSDATGSSDASGVADASGIAWSSVGFTDRTLRTLEGRRVPVNRERQRPSELRRTSC